MNMVNIFLEKKNVFAVVGVSRDEKKYGRKIYDYLKNLNYEVYPINPNLNMIENVKCYSILSELPKIPDVVVFVVTPKVTEQILIECKKLGITKAWMQTGSESNEAIAFCKENNIEVLHNVCILMEMN